MNTEPNWAMLAEAERAVVDALAVNLFAKSNVLSPEATVSDEGIAYRTATRRLAIFAAKAHGD